MKDFDGKIQLEGREYPIAFDLNVLETIQEKYGSMQAWSEMIEPEDGEANVSALLFGFTEMINEGIDIENDKHNTQIPFLTKKQVGRILTEFGMANAAQKLKSVVVESTKSEEKNT